MFPLPVGLPISRSTRTWRSPRVLRGVRNKSAARRRSWRRCLTRAALWDEVKDRLDALGSLLSGGQQQRLTIARALSHGARPAACSTSSAIAVDPVTTMRIEAVLDELRSEMTIVLVTNLVQQARRLADRTAFFLTGEVRGGRRPPRTIFDGQVSDRTNGPSTTSRGKLWLTRCPPQRARHREASPSRPAAYSLWYGDFQALFDVDMQVKKGINHLDDRPLGVRQDHHAAHLQPDQRASGLRAHHGQRVRARARHLRRRRRDRAGAQAGGHGLPAPQPAADSDSGQRAVRVPAAPGARAEGEARGRGRGARVGAAAGGSSGTRSRIASTSPPRAFRSRSSRSSASRGCCR